MLCHQVDIECESGYIHLEVYVNKPIVIVKSTGEHCQCVKDVNISDVNRA